MDLMIRMSYAPARLYDLDAGYIKEGGPADLVIFEDQTPFTVESFHSKSSNSPFLGASLYGRVKYTICGGKVVYQDETSSR